MDKDYFLLKDKIDYLKTRFIKNGWLTIYEYEYESSENEIKNDSMIYPCIVYPDRFEEYKNNRKWGIRPGEEGKPTIYSNGKYATSSYDGLEPFIFIRYFKFDGGQDKHIDVSEEFILYFKLYEKLENKQNRIYYYIDSLGGLEEVVKVEKNKVQVKLKYLMEYISIRKVHFITCFDSQRVTGKTLDELGLAPKDEDFSSNYYFYNHYIRELKVRSQSWIFGKLFICYNPEKSINYHFDNHQYAEFLTDYDEVGNEVFQTCEKSVEKCLVLTYFKKEVLNKYYNEPNKYKVTGWRVSSDFFSLKIDNNIDDYVAVFLTALGVIPYKEQLHWKQYNIPPKNKISHSYYETMVLGKFVDYPETPDLLFKARYKEFNKRWEQKFGWKLYKPLSPEDEHNFVSLHIPTTNNIKAFCEQVLSIVKITIDSLNEKEIKKGLKLEEKDRGISKFDKFLKSKDCDIPDMIKFLRSLQDLRSGLIAHRFSKSNKNVKRALEYFEIKDDNLVEVATDIFIKSIRTLDTLESSLIPDEREPIMI